MRFVSRKRVRFLKVYLVAYAWSKIGTLRLIRKQLILVKRGCSVDWVGQVIETLDTVITDETLNVAAVIDIGSLSFVLHSCKHLHHFLEVNLTVLVLELLYNLFTITNQLSYLVFLAQLQNGWVLKQVSYPLGLILLVEQFGSLIKRENSFEHD